MASRLSHREPRSSLFAGYDSANSSKRGHSNSPQPAAAAAGVGGYGYQAPRSSSAVGAYPGGPSGSASPGGFRSATPNKRGQYSDAVLSELESQNDEQLGNMSAKVKMLKDLTMSIGDEIRDSTALAEKMNDSFENTRVRLRGTMNRMLRMAEKTGVSWKIWLLFFGAVILLFLYVKWS